MRGRIPRDITQNQSREVEITTKTRRSSDMLREVCREVEIAIKMRRRCFDTRIVHDEDET